MNKLLSLGFSAALGALLVVGCSRQVTMSAGQSELLSGSRAEVQVKGKAGQQKGEVDAQSADAQVPPTGADGVAEGAATPGSQTAPSTSEDSTASVESSLPEGAPDQIVASSSPSNQACMELNNGRGNGASKGDSEQCDVSDHPGAGGDNGGQNPQKALNEARKAARDAEKEARKLEKTAAQVEKTFGNDEESVGACEAHFQKKVLSMKIAGSRNVEHVDGKEVMAFKVTGNQNQLDIKYAREAGAQSSDSNPVFEGLCVFAAGNKAKINVSLDGATINKVVFVGRGNLADFNVSIVGSGKIGKLVFDGKGNQPSVEVVAPSCDAVEMESIGKYSATCKPQ